MLLCDNGRDGCLRAKSLIRADLCKSNEILRLVEEVYGRLGPIEYNYKGWTI